MTLKNIIQDPNLSFVVLNIVIGCVSEGIKVTKDRRNGIVRTDISVLDSTNLNDLKGNDCNPPVHAENKNFRVNDAIFKVFNQEVRALLDITSALDGI